MNMIVFHTANPMDRYPILKPLLQTTVGSGMNELIKNNYKQKNDLQRK